MSKEHQVLSLLMDIEAELRVLQCWDAEPPSAEALASTQPFCVDTLSFPQWLQWVFIERLRAMIEAGQTLPGQCGIAPMVEEWGRGLPLATDKLQAILIAMDEVLSA